MQTLFHKFKGFVRLWPETWGLPLAVIGLYYSYFLIWFIFPFAVPYPPESLQKFMFAGIAMLLYNALVWLGIKLNMFGMYDFYKNSFSTSFKRLRSWQKFTFLFVAYFGLFYFLVRLAELM